MQKTCQTGLSWAGDESWQAGSRPVAKAVWEERLLQAPFCGGCQTGANMSKPCQLLLPPKKKGLLMGCVGSWSWKGPGEAGRSLRGGGRGSMSWGEPRQGGKIQGTGFQTPDPFLLLSLCPLAMQLLLLFQSEKHHFCYYPG